MKSNFWNIWQSYNGGLWTITYRQNLTPLQAAAQLSALVEGETKLRNGLTPGEAEYKIMPARQEDE